MANSCPYYRVHAPLVGSVRRECNLIGQNVEETKARHTCTSDYSKCIVYKSKK